MSQSTPQASILIPAYNPAFFEQALRSALAQTCPDIEIVVSDDSPGPDIGAIARRYSDARVRYVRNEVNLGFAGNFTRCFTLARGEYVKFLNDDDVLHPDCVRRMLAAFDEHPGVTLVTSKWRMINERHEPLKDVFATAPLASVECRIKGRALGDHALAHNTNFIGEPTTVLFRKADITMQRDNIVHLAGHDYVCLADLSLWLRLLARGDAVYFPEELSLFRIHAGQEQRKPDVALACLTERFDLIADARSLGFLHSRRAHHAALKSLLDMYESVLSGPALDAPTRERIQALRQSLLAETERLRAGEEKDGAS